VGFVLGVILPLVPGFFEAKVRCNLVPRKSVYVPSEYVCAYLHDAQKRLRVITYKMLELLLIEDNPGDVRLLEEAFRELGADIHMQVAKDGAEGLQMIFQTPHLKTGWHPDIILLDLNLPKVSGHDVLARIKNNPQTCRIPVIILTSSRAESDVRRAYDSHANAYLRKPSTLDGLISAAQHIKSFWMETATLPS
jgi:two-component system, chemotaxis family, response regulator Rcp1